MFCVQGFIVTDRFRELERPQTGRLKDVVLMATVSGFESLRIPRKSDMKQFAELFEPLFLGSSSEARRQAAAALSQCPHVPEPVAALIGSMPISIAAIFLTRSQALSDRTLIGIIRQQTAAHASAIARRAALSPSVIDALVEHHNPAGLSARPDVRQRPVTEPPAPAKPDADAEAARNAREETLRAEIKALARAGAHEAAAAASTIIPITATLSALLVRFARSGEIILFSRALATALDAGGPLVERILLDVSGQQLATSLIALSMPTDDLIFVLQSLYPHLAECIGGASRAKALTGTMDPTSSRERLDAWLQSEARDGAPAARHQTYLADDHANDARQPAIRKVAKTAGGAKSQRVFGRG
ncbi:MULTISPECIES: DUF2336 domain-containing protein [unclassified Ensifer]|uniref:DUF2336 domain-containing protein n=1 Tax=unclassified Ensifer TaxID=2633371 RepID=UPI0008138655|nr:MULTISPECIES: DUF2336 domain-containing protein [unclassified Ensifer]OCP24599.1 hypothetical protein BC361_20055 [Ensifer sp. LC54]OCP26151.1 hypothetical protein BC363_18480 [Ensifer sp. LC384]